MGALITALRRGLALAGLLVLTFGLAACGGGGGGGESWTVTTTAGSGGTISPASRTVNNGATTTFTVTPDAGYTRGSVTGCGGALVGDTYTTGAITGACTVTASFTPVYTIGGNVTGLADGASLVLTNNDADDLTISGNGSFTFNTAIADGSGYAVAVATQPASHTCSVSNGTGTVSGANVTSVAVSCVLVPPPAPAVTLGYGVKELQFSWNAVGGATHYQLFEDPDGASGYTQVGGDLTATSVNYDITLYRRVNASYIVSACNSAGCTDSAAIALAERLVPAIGHAKASNTQADDSFGSAVALSADGTTLAVGAYAEDSNATGINGDQANNSASFAGAVYVFTRSGTTWVQQAYVKASNAGTAARFGYSLALSADGNTLAVGAYGEQSSATGINGDQANGYLTSAGAVYVFTRSGDTWSQQAYVKASNTAMYDAFGYALALSADGNTLAVGAQQEGSNATGIDGDQSDNGASGAGAVYVFTRSAGAWSQQAYVKASNTEAGDNFGRALALSADGNTLAVGAWQEGSNATGIGGDQANNAATQAGAVYVFTRSAGAWSQQAYVKASNTGAGDVFGFALALSADGNTLAVGAYTEDSNAIGIDGEQTNNSMINSGAVYVFTRSAGAWSQQAYVKASNAWTQDAFGIALALSADGNTLAVGASQEDSNATGIDGDQSNNAATDAGAVYLFTRSAGTWSQQSYLKASNTGASDNFGGSLALSGDGHTLAVGAYGEDSSATGVCASGDSACATGLANNSASNAGAVYLY